MDINVDSHLNAIERQVELTERDEKAVSTVKVARSFNTSMQNMWDALTNRERISQWFLPITGDLELGGSYALEGNASGSITACTPRSHVSLTWEFAGDISWVDLRVSERAPDSVILELDHTAVLSPHWDQFGAGATGVGWEMGYLGLFLYLVHPNEDKLDEEAFTVSEEGNRFITGSSQGWANASIAAGIDATMANAAAERTTAFYLGI